MHLLKPDLHARRAFLARAGQLAVAGAAAPLGLNLAAIGEAAAMQSSGYKALVCVFLTGGNDQDNTLVPYDEASYDIYHQVRGGSPGRNAGGIAFARASLQASVLQPSVALPGGRQYALHPSAAALKPLFDAGKLAVQLNVGPLVVPMTRALYSGTDRQRYPLPARLFSHSDQDKAWQLASTETQSAGWGGRLGDLALQANGGSLFTSIGCGGDALFLVGQSAAQYQVTIAGPEPFQCLEGFTYGSSAVRDALATLLTRAPSGVLEAEHARAAATSIAAGRQLSTALGSGNVATSFPGSDLGDKLRIVARILAARGTLGVSRQVFMVLSQASFDHHDGLLNRHASLMSDLSAAMAAFHKATVELGIEDQVTLFTASEFGRTLVNNGNGTDHGWGGHHFMLGGAVRGRAFYGSAPPVSVGNTSAPEDQWHVGQGRLIPSTALDQFAATLGRWFGAQPDELAGLLPSLRNFGAEAGQPAYPRDLGFLG